MRRTDGGVAAGSALGAIGSAVAALAGTLCCAGPAVVAIIGAGGALAAARLEPYRPLFLAVSAALLGFGFWRAYRRPPPGPSGASCSRRTGGAVRGILWAALALFALSAVAPRLWS
jgi:mercuric ion transport protein